MTYARIRGPARKLIYMFLSTCCSHYVLVYFVRYNKMLGRELQCPLPVGSNPVDFPCAEATCNLGVEWDYVGTSPCKNDVSKSCITCKQTRTLASNHCCCMHGRPCLQDAPGVTCNNETKFKHSSQCRPVWASYCSPIDDPVKIVERVPTAECMDFSKREYSGRGLHLGQTLNLKPLLSKASQQYCELKPYDPKCNCINTPMVLTSIPDSMYSGILGRLQCWYAPCQTSSTTLKTTGISEQQGCKCTADFLNNTLVAGALCGTRQRQTIQSLNEYIKKNDSALF